MVSESPVVGLDATEEPRTLFDMRLYYGTRDNLVQELKYNSVNKTWEIGFLFTMLNGNSGITLSGVLIRYIVCLNSAYQLEIWWNDFNESSVASPTHPIGEWTRGMYQSMAKRVYVLTLLSGAVATNATVGHNSSISWINGVSVLYQDSSNKIVAIQLEGRSETVDFIYNERMQDGRYALAAEPNTRAKSFRIYQGNVMKYVYFLQTNKSNIVELRFKDNSFTEYTTRVVYGG